MQIAMEDDGVSVRTKDSRGVVRRFDSRTGADKPLPAAVAENSRVLAIDSEARASVVVGTDNIPRLLPATGDPILLHFDGAGGDCRAAVFVANGALVYTLSPDGIRCWDSVSGQPVGPVLQHAGAQYLALSSDGRRLFSWSAKNIRAWDVPTVVDQAPSERRRAVRIQTGAELAQGGSIRFLSALAWQELHKSTP
jgi:WD40 repeat protein